MTLHSKKRGRPVGSKNKPKVGRPKKTVLKQATIKSANLDAQIQLLFENSKFMKQIKNLEHQAIGYRAVISYLEHQLGKQNGAPV